MDEYCKLQSGEIFQDFDCVLNFAGEKSDRFYHIQVLKNHKGFHVWTRWGRNGTGGQSKLDGPLSQANAEKNFKKKFLEKTKNSWDKRLQFVAVKGKYTLVQKTDSSQISQAADSQ
ncbi:Poly [ADP-ribose] polymerase 3, partial [Paramuricea clavata]